MDIQLYVYDLSQGLARELSRSFLGVQIDAVYHTSLVFGGVEYFFGRGVQTSSPGRTHHGRPMEVIQLGQTSLPLDVIMEYLESLKTVYTPESYDLFAHNCNNFTHDFSMFLLGKGIPEHITSLPQRVLDTPFGSMLKRQIDQSMRPIVQAPVPRHQDVASGLHQTKSKTQDHPHKDLKLSLFLKCLTEPILYKRCPPLTKLTAKLPEQTSQSPNFKSAISFLSHVDSRNAPLPDVSCIMSFFRASTDSVSTDSLFALYDLARTMLADARVSGLVAESNNGPQTISELISKTNGLGADCPYSLKLVTLQLCCNLFSSSLMSTKVVENDQLANEVIKLCASEILEGPSEGESDSASNLAKSAANLAFNIACVVREKRETTVALDGADESSQVELLASILSRLSSDASKNPETIHALALAAANLLYCADVHGEVAELCRVMDAKSIILGKQNSVSANHKGLLSEIGNELFGQGLEMHST